MSFYKCSFRKIKWVCRWYLTIILLWSCFGIETASSFMLPNHHHHHHYCLGGDCCSKNSFILHSRRHNNVIHNTYNNNRGSSWELYESTSSSSSSNSGMISRKEQLLGTSVLLTVPLAWGTYAPAVRYMYENVSPAVPGIVFSAMYYVVACVTLSSLQYFTKNDTMPTTTSNDDDDNTNRIRMAGLELGGYLFIGNWLQVTGLQTVPADRAAFLVQLTTLFVPLTQAAIMKKKLPLSTWIACLLAFAGVIIMTMDDSTTNDSNNTSMMMMAKTISSGDILIVLAAMSYTLHVVRLSAYTAPSTSSSNNNDTAMTTNDKSTSSCMSPLALAASKATTEAILSVGVVLWYCFTASQQQQEGIVDSQQVSAYVQDQLLQHTLSPVVAITVLWTGWITCAYTIYAQSFGQARITSPTDANLIYSTQPIFSAIFAYFLLQEQLGTNGIIGASLIGAALYLITISDSPLLTDTTNTKNNNIIIDKKSYKK